MLRQSRMASVETRARATETDAVIPSGRDGVKRAILPAAISDTTAAQQGDRWLAETVGSESSYRGDEVAGCETEIDDRLKQNPAYSRSRNRVLPLAEATSKLTRE